MKVERTNDGLLIRIPGNLTSSRIQSIMDYLRYEELTAESRVSQKDLDELISKVKKGRWNRIKKEIDL